MYEFRVYDPSEDILEPLATRATMESAERFAKDLKKPTVEIEHWLITDETEDLIAVHYIEDGELVHTEPHDP